MKFYENSILRSIVLPLLKRMGRDITIKHHFTGDSLLLHSYRHKGYWYHGKHREESTIEMFKKCIKQGNNVIEVGGHIGYMSLLFSQLAGDKGKVFVFEPSINNLPYIRENIKKKANVQLIEKGAGDKNETATFFMDNLTGQNNSFVEDFDGFKSNQSASYDKSSGLTKVEVPIVTLDSFVLSENINNVNFIKIDVEGFEYEVLLGAKDLLKKYHPSIMVEVQRNQAPLADFLFELNYKLYDDNGFQLDKKGIESCNSQNVFAFFNEEEK